MLSISSSHDMITIFSPIRHPHLLGNKGQCLYVYNFKVQGLSLLLESLFRIHLLSLHHRSFQELAPFHVSSFFFFLSPNLLMSLIFFFLTLQNFSLHLDAFSIIYKQVQHISTSKDISLNYCNLFSF